MNQPELWTMSLQAFAAVLTVLGLLAVAVQLLTMVFRAAVPDAAARTVPPGAPASTPAAGPGPDPTSDPTSDPFVQAAVQAAVRQVAPDAVVVRVDAVEEERPR